MNLTVKVVNFHLSLKVRVAGMNEPKPWMNDTNDTVTTMAQVVEAVSDHKECGQSVSLVTPVKSSRSVTRIRFSLWPFNRPTTMAHLALQTILMALGPGDRR